MPRRKSVEQQAEHVQRLILDTIELNVTAMHEEALDRARLRENLIIEQARKLASKQCGRSACRRAGICNCYDDEWPKAFRRHKALH